MTTVVEAATGLRRLAHAAGGDPYGVRTLAGARAAYVRGDIEVDELERRVELFLRAAAGEIMIGVLEPGERVLSLAQ